MIVPITLENTLSTVKNIAIGYRELTFCKPNHIEEDQVGYRINPDGQSLTGTNEGDWKEEWIVIGWDDLGDPVFVDAKTTALPVFTAEHGMGAWQPVLIAESLDSFAAMISKLKVLSKGRTNPVALERKPILEAEREAFLSFVQQTNPNADTTFWEAFLEDE